MKLLVETPGNYGLYDLAARQVIQANRPTVVENTTFIQVNKGSKLTVLEVLADDASDMPLQMAKTPEELAAAIADLPRKEPVTTAPTKTTAKQVEPTKATAKPKKPQPEAE